MRRYQQNEQSSNENMDRQTAGWINGQTIGQNVGRTEGCWDRQKKY